MKHTTISILLAAGAALCARALPADSYPSHSHIREGLWVHVTTDREGIWQISHDRLREMGFADPTRVHVWGTDIFDLSTHVFSATTADPLVQTPSTHTADGRLLFYGRAPYHVSVPSTGLSTESYTYQRDSYSMTASYLLTDAEGDDLPVAPYTRASTQYAPMESHIHLDLFEEELHRPVAGGVLALGQRYTAGDRADFDFHIRHWSTSGYSPRAMFSHMIVSASAATSRMEALTPEGTTRLRNTAKTAYAVTFPTAFSDNTGTIWFEPADGRTDRDLTVSVPIPTSTPYTYVAADYGILAYYRDNVVDATDPSVVMVLGRDDGKRGRSLVMPGASATTRVWAVDRLRECAELEGDMEPGGPLRFTLPRDMTRMVAFDTALDFPGPTVVGAIPCRDLRAEQVPHMLIVTTDAMRAAAEQLADIHRTMQGLDVLVVTQKELNNEFAAGAPHAMNARLMAKMLYDRDPAKFKYVLMYGPSTADPRRIDTPLDFEALICYENDNRHDSSDHVRCFASDKYFGMLDDSYDHSRMVASTTNVAVGRVSARTVASARDFNRKARLWLTDPPAPATTASAVLISGDGNLNAHVEHALRVQSAMAAANPSMTFTQVPTKVFYPDLRGTLAPHRRVMCDALRRGAGFMGYSGHGSVNFIEAASLLSTGIVASTPYSHPPLAVLASCAQYTFDRLGSSLLETMVLTPGGGAIAGVASSRDVYLRYNILTYETVGAAYAAATPGATIGSVYLDARRRLLDMIPVQSSYMPDELVNDMCYNLAGDPALPLFKPSHTIALDNPGTIVPLAASAVSGTIMGADGKPDTTFDGPVTVTVYDGSREVTTRNSSNEADFKPLTFDIENDVLATAQGTARSGRFTLDLTVPEPVFSAGSYTVIASAVRDDDAGDGALGRSAFTVEAAARPGDTPELPSILAIYADSPDYVSGDAVGATFTLYADIAPGTTGLNFSTGGISSHSRVMVDSNISYTGIGGYFSRMDGGTMRLAMPMADLADGYHSIELTVADNAGHIDKASLDVHVLSHGATDGCAVTLDRATADTDVTIGLDGDATATRLVITDAGGRTVYTAATPTLPLRWDLRGTDGTTVHDGRYTVRMYVRKGGDYGQAATATLVVLR